MIKKIFYIALFYFTPLLSQEFNFLNFPVQESGRIKPLDTFARNHLLAFYGKRTLTNINLSATDWTRPADFDPGSLVHKIGEILKPTR